MYSDHYRQVPVKIRVWSLCFVIFYGVCLVQVIEALKGLGCQKVCAANQFSLALAGGKVTSLSFKIGHCSKTVDGFSTLGLYSEATPLIRTL